MAIKQNMDKPIFSANNGRVYAIADEANDGIKAVPAELVVKAADDSTFTQISESNPLPVKMDGVELSIDPSSPLPVTGDVQLTGSNLRIEGSNNTLASGAITLANPLEVNATTDHRGILIATSGDTGVEMGFEHYVNGIGWLPWKDGLGAPVVVYLDENAVYGPFQGFPLFDRGRLTLIAGSDMSSNVAKGKTYEASSLLEDSSISNAFDESRDTFYASEITFNKDVWVSVDLGVAQPLSILQMWGRDGSGTIQNFRFEGTNHSIDAPDAEWDVLVTDVLQRNGEDQQWEINAPAYRYYRIFALDNYGAGNISMYDVRLFSSPQINVVVQGVL